MFSRLVPREGVELRSPSLWEYKVPSDMNVKHDYCCCRYHKILESQNSAQCRRKVLLGVASDLPASHRPKIGSNVLL